MQNPALSEKILADIDAACVELYSDGPRSHLGASVIGKSCTRRLWYEFRWVKHQKFDGRMLRLFNRGHREEERFISWLKKAGFEVRSHDAAGKQYRVSAIMNHFGGSCDGIVRFPPHYGIDKDFILEFKTKGTGSGFNKLKEDGVKEAESVHFAQMSIYGYLMNITHALYFSINKNDDSIHPEVVELDFVLADMLLGRAERIVRAKEPPERISNNPAWYECNICHLREVCHKNADYDVNCRSCTNSVATENGTWTCKKFGLIPQDYIPKGCPSWEKIK